MACIASYATRAFKNSALNVKLPRAGGPRLIAQSSLSDQPPRTFNFVNCDKLTQLPDFVTGYAALEARKFGEASPHLKRAVEVASKYFPSLGAGAELALCRSSYARCLWYQGHFQEAAKQFQLGLDDMRSQQIEGPQAAKKAAAATSRLAEAAARVHFELGHFRLAQVFAADASKAWLPSMHPRTRMLEEAILAVTSGRGDRSYSNEKDQLPEAEELTATQRLELKATRLVNSLTAQALPDDLSRDPEIFKLDTEENRCLARLLGMDSSGNIIPDSTEEEQEFSKKEIMQADILQDAEDMLPLSITRMALRSTVGQLAVLSGACGETWVQPLLLAAKDDFERLQPGGPATEPFLYRTLAALGNMSGPYPGARASSKSMEHMRQAMQKAAAHRPGRGAGVVETTGRKGIWRGMLLTSYAELLEESADAEQHIPEIAGLRAQAADAFGVPEIPGEQGHDASELSEKLKTKLEVFMSPTTLRWALIYLPAPEQLRMNELPVHVQSESSLK
eukprot:TRINITY_DN27632_c0_g2_i1.p1 TRINITY_DN27632_c0_g2~~TRINITY_DN27632_c0_g2_i1.p1  ORF type:complete len:527 (+),score=100.85 TRINITY_DN27632_c0_g2_i1:62-1582(+)